MPAQRRVSLTEILSDIRAGLSDSELLDKHGLTPDELKTVLDKLVESGKLTRPDPDWRRKAANGTVGGIALLSIIFLLAYSHSHTGGWFSIFQPPMGDVHFILRLESFFLSLLPFIGTGLLIRGCYFLAKGKGYHGAWCVLGVFFCIGVPILLILPNKFAEEKTSLFSRVLVFGAIVGIIFGIAASYYIANIPKKRASCDQAAEVDAQKLARALERLANELIDLQCDYKNWKITSSHLRHMVGPYYDFEGGSGTCDVRFRVERDEIWVSAGKGSQPDGSDSRYIYRLQARPGGAELPRIIGPFGGISLPITAQEIAHCFTETIVSDCSYRFERKPRGAVNADMVRACAERKAKAPTQQRQNFHSLATDVINVFSSDLYRKLAHDDHNLLFSPLSVFVPLVMAYEGARGSTRTEMAAVLHTDKAKVPLHPTLGALVSDLDCSVASADGLLLMANALWGQKDYGFSKEYQDLLQTHYGSGIKEVDYRSPGAEKIINQWVAQQTQGKITEMVKLNAGNALTQLLTANAVYFNCAWATKFPMESTKDDKFTLLDGNKIMVPMMATKSNRFGYLQEDGFQAVELEYGEGELSMLVFLPRKTNGLLELEKSLTGEKPSRWSNPLSPWPGGVHVFLPRFYIERRFELSGILESMGIKLAFSGSADFTGISGPRLPGGGLYMAGMIHQAGIDVSEEGTEAWAVSINCHGLIGTDGPDINKDKPVVFRADHPFMFMIRHNPSGAILFMGRVTNSME